jgi:hypothetical protein
MNRLFCGDRQRDPDGSEGGRMFYWFQRGEQFLRYESREVSKGAYQLVVVMAGGSERVEHFTDGAALHARQVALQHELEDDGWNGPHGWNL